jgi:DNA-binding response OmpR family regulator
MSTKLLLIDDDDALLDMLAMAFEDEGLEVHCASDGQKGLEEVARLAPGVVITDINMPRIDGFTLCRKLREQGNEVPLILLTSRDSEIDEALGLELGADDYVTKPFSSRVLVARVKALMRRQAARSGEDASHSEDLRVRCGQLELDSARLEAFYAGKIFQVTLTEFRMLEVFARNPGIVYTRQQLLDRIRGDDSIVAERIIDTYIRRLRRKLEEYDSSFDCIETVVGAGYRWRGERED